MRYKYTDWRDGSVPEEVFQALYDEIVRQDLECADNYRFTPEDDARGLGEYEEIKNYGCCGSWDGTVKDNTGRTWLIGCNHGH